MIDIKQIQAEYYKCAIDKTRVYMISHFLKTYDMTVQKDVIFNLFPRQIDYLNALNEHTNNITTKPRQAGITTVTAAKLACEVVLSDASSPLTILIVGNTRDLAKLMLSKIKTFLEDLPRWFWGDEYWSPDKDDPKNIKKIFKVNNQFELKLFNGCQLYARGSGKETTRGVSSVSWLVLDEAAFIEEGESVYASAVPTVSTGGHIIMISTPNGKDKLYYTTFNAAKKKANNFHVTEFRWYEDPRYNKFLKWQKKNKETNDIKTLEEEVIDTQGNVKYDREKWTALEQEGWKPTSPWYEKMKNSLNHDSIKIAQELDVSFIGSNDSVLSGEEIERHETANVREPDINYRDIYSQDSWKWKNPVEGHRYIVSVDASTGSGDDATAIEVIDLDAIDEKTGFPYFEQVFEYNGKMKAEDVGDMVYTYANVYNTALVVVDCIGGYGDPIIFRLRSLGYQNLYSDDPSLSTYIKEKTEVAIQNEDDKLPGYHTKSTRTPMLSNFADAIRKDSIKIRSARVIRELETWIFKNGRMDHMSGYHDDTITCLAMGIFVAQFSLNRMIAQKAKDKAAVEAWTKGGIFSSNYYKNKENKNNPEKQPNNPNQPTNEELMKKYNSILPIMKLGSKNTTNLDFGWQCKFYR